MVARQQPSPFLTMPIPTMMHLDHGSSGKQLVIAHSMRFDTHPYDKCEFQAVAPPDENGNLDDVYTSDVVFCKIEDANIFLCDRH